ncbi:hypothetical protein PSEUDO8Z_100434 [Pseudomonas sp. 8Z]|nr:hypothetical protein PSEUDO8Z_100434 [Pseudomonas sp. 8Z]
MRLIQFENEQGLHQVDVVIGERIKMVRDARRELA